MARRWGRAGGVRWGPLVLCVACALPTACQAPDGTDEADAPTWVERTAARRHLRRVVVRYRDGVQAQDALLGHRPAFPAELQPLRRMQNLKTDVLSLDEGASLDDALAALRARPDVLWAEPDLPRQAFSNDPLWNVQWNLEQLHAEQAWSMSTGSGVTVAVLDTGCTSGPDDGLTHLSPRGYDFVNGDDDASDDNGHGTHVAGTINQRTGNGVGVAGLAHQATILPIKVLDERGGGFMSDVLSGIEYAIEQGADIINLSLGGSSPSEIERQAMMDAMQAGVLIVAATGNGGRNQVSYPAGFSTVLAVGATDYAMERASYSNYGMRLDLVAPGGDAHADLNGDGLSDLIFQETLAPEWDYWGMQGTSMATPHVSAAAALLMSAGATASEAAAYLTSTTLDIGDAGWDRQTGKGLVQPAAALEAWLADQRARDGERCKVEVVAARYRPDCGRLLVRVDNHLPTDELTLWVDGRPTGRVLYNWHKQSWQISVLMEQRPGRVSVRGSCGSRDDVDVAYVRVASDDEP